MPEVSTGICALLCVPAELFREKQSAEARWLELRHRTAGLRGCSSGMTSLGQSHGESDLMEVSQMQATGFTGHYARSQAFTEYVCCACLAQPACLGLLCPLIPHCSLSTEQACGTAQASPLLLRCIQSWVPLQALQKDSHHQIKRQAQKGPAVPPIAAVVCGAVLAGALLVRKFLRGSRQGPGATPEAAVYSGLLEPVHLQMSSNQDALDKSHALADVSLAFSPL